MSSTNVSSVFVMRKVMEASVKQQAGRRDRKANQMNSARARKFLFKCPEWPDSFVVCMCATRRRAPDTKRNRRNHEQSSSIGRHEKRRVHFDGGWQAPELGRQRPALRGLGDVSSQRLARGSESHLRVANE